VPAPIGSTCGTLADVNVQVTATEALGKMLDNSGLQIFGGVMVGCIVVVWIGVFITMIYRLKSRELLWPKE